MNAQAILNDIESLPPEKQEEVADFITFLKNRFAIKKSKVSVKDTGTSTLSEGFFGMWADRESMKDSALWVRQLRKSEWKARDA